MWLLMQVQARSGVKVVAAAEVAASISCTLMTSLIGYLADPDRLPRAQQVLHNNNILI